ncbi:23S rRNA (uracil(1939)-C(5))-methyltransferase RlmD [Bernardetia sp.]|uniref:23S rRNA (uracil(1939)-C(5))-methyltransferase RlmD n=1 Tax=Bernardetia sp. TaxID=1937974 RepID=UPI0025C0E41D|nr:23S rRNA (uracil(1939)-C(5))-methyltransferase RlmD [Bernardetia sp.]
MGRRKNKNRIVENVVILDAGAEGKCIARPEEADGRVVFITGVAPKDVVDVRVTKQRKSYWEATPVKFHSYSDERVEPFCKHFGVCGGCKWQHLSYENQLKYKQKQVKDNLERLAKVELPEIKPILASDETTFYRNKLEYTFSSRRWLTKEQISSGEDFDNRALGFHIPGRFDKIVDIDECYLQAEPSNTIRLEINKYARENDLEFYDVVNHTGLLRNLMIRSSQTTQDLMVMLQITAFNEKTESLLHFIKDSFPEITSLQYVINTKKNDTFHDLEVVCFDGKDYITETMEGLEFRIQAKSFYQTNSIQAYNLYKITRDFAGLTGNEVVYDLYTGTGTIANFVAKQAKQVIGVEYVEAAIEDAKVNSKLNGIENTLFYAGDMKDVLNEEFLEKHARPDVILTDPPRAGMHPDVIQMLLRIRAKHIVYVSCNPATQARDLQLLDEKYSVKAIQPVDMFPQTHHVENVVLLELK